MIGSPPNICNGAVFPKRLLAQMSRVAADVRTGFFVGCLSFAMMRPGCNDVERGKLHVFRRLDNFLRVNRPSNGSTTYPKHIIDRRVPVVTNLLDMLENMFCLISRPLLLPFRGCRSPGVASVHVQPPVVGVTVKQ